MYELNIDKASYIDTNLIVGRVMDLPLDKPMFRVYNADKIVDLTNATIEFRGLNSMGGKIVNLGGAKITNAKGGEFEFTIPAEFYSSKGKFRNAYFAIKRNGRTDTTNDLIIEVLNAITLSDKDAEVVIDGLDELIKELVAKVEKDLEKANASLKQLQNNLTELDKQYKLIVARIDAELSSANAKVVELRKRLEELEAKIKEANLLTEGKLMELIDPLDKGYRMFTRDTRNVARISTPYDLGKRESMDWTYIDSPIDSSLPPDIKGIAGWLQKSLTNTSMGLIYITNHTSRRVYFGNAYGGENVVWNRVMNWNEFDILLYGDTRRLLSDNVTYENKVAGSNVANPHRAENVSNKGTVSPTSSYLEFAQASYDRITPKSTVPYTNTTGVVDNSINVPLVFNFKEQITRDYPQLKGLPWEKIVQYLNSYEVTVMASSVGTGDTSLYRVSSANTSNPLYVSASTVSSETLSPLKFSVYGLSGMNSTVFNDGLVKFLVMGPPAVTGVPKGVRIGEVSLKYTIDLPNFSEIMLEKVIQYDKTKSTPTVANPDLRGATSSVPWTYFPSATNTPKGIISGYYKVEWVNATFQKVFATDALSNRLFTTTRTNNGWYPWVEIPTATIP